jgi:hypothetical protein
MWICAFSAEYVLQRIQPECKKTFLQVLLDVSYEKILSELIACPPLGRISVVTNVVRPEPLISTGWRRSTHAI